MSTQEERDSAMRRARAGFSAQLRVNRQRHIARRLMVLGVAAALLALALALYAQWAR